MRTGTKEQIDISDVRIAFIDWRSPSAEDKSADGNDDLLRSKDGGKPTIPPGYAPL